MTLKKQLSQEREAHFSEQRRHEATQRELVKLKKRTAKGVCPCCQRSFVNMQRHMKTKHPEFPAEGK